MGIPADLQGRVAVYPAPRQPFEIHVLPVRAPRAGEVLVRIRMSTICRSDIHSWLGHRPNPCPGLLGHEIVGTIVELGAGITHDMRGELLTEGDRITWSEYFVPPGGSFCADVLDLPQKSPGVDKYGHMAVSTPPHHHGGVGDYCSGLSRSWILKLPDDLSDEEAAPINCGVATMVCVTEQAQIGLGETVVIQGLGLLGLYGAALAKGRGARLVIGLDAVSARRELALKFGVDHVLDPLAMAGDQLVHAVHALSPPDGADAVIEVCGDPQVIPDGMRMLRTGGRCVLGGVVNPESMVSLDANLVLRRLLTLRGVHNYHPRHLAQALDFVQANRRRFAFHDLVDGKYSLADVGTAMRDAEQRRVLRAAIVP